MRTQRTATAHTSTAVTHLIWADEATDHFNPMSHAVQALAFVNRALDQFVIAAREAGYTWDQIAEATQMTRQGAHKRWSALEATCTCNEAWCPKHDADPAPLGAVLTPPAIVEVCPGCAHALHAFDTCNACPCVDGPGIIEPQPKLTAKAASSRTKSTRTKSTARRSETILQRAERITASRNSELSL